MLLICWVSFHVKINSPDITRTFWEQTISYEASDKIIVWNMDVMSAGSSKLFYQFSTIVGFGSEFQRLKCHGDKRWSEQQT